MSKLHKLNRKSSKSHIDSARKILENMESKNRSKAVIVQERIKQLDAGFGRPPQRVIDAFKNGVAAETKSFKTDGTRLLFNGHEVARKKAGGIAVSFAGFDTSMTAATIRSLGVDTRKVKGITMINGKVVDPESRRFTFVPNEKISSGIFRVSKPSNRSISETRGVIDDQEKFRKKVRKEFGGAANAIPQDPTAIQPRDQKEINKLTGVSSKIPRETKGADTHHLLPKSAFPGLRTNTFNGVPLSKKNHRSLHNLNADIGFKRIAELQARLAKFINPIIRKKKTGNVKRKITVKRGMIQTAKHLSASSIIASFKKSGIDTKGANGIYDPILNRVLDARIPAEKARIQTLFESGDRNIGFNSVTDTRSGPNTSIDLVEQQLKDIESRGGIPSLGFDNGSFEANDTILGNTDDIMSKLLDTQKSTGIVSPNAELEIRDNPRFIG